MIMALSMWDIFKLGSLFRAEENWKFLAVDDTGDLAIVNSSSELERMVVVSSRQVISMSMVFLTLRVSYISETTLPSLHQISLKRMPLMDTGIT
jgi:hypothetical protein